MSDVRVHTWPSQCLKVGVRPIWNLGRGITIANECPHQGTPVHPLRTGPLYAAQAHVPHDSPPARVYRHTVHPAQLCSRHNMSARRKRRPSPSLYSVSSDELESDSMEFRWDELHVCGVRFIKKSRQIWVFKVLRSEAWLVTTQKVGLDHGSGEV